MTPNAQHKRAERERRKAAGEVRCEVWLDKQAQADLDKISSLCDGSKENAIVNALWSLACKLRDPRND